MQIDFKKIRKNKLPFIIILSALFSILMIPQIQWLQDNFYNPWKNAFDSVWFRLPATVFLSLILGFIYFLLLDKINKKLFRKKEKEFYSQMAAVHLSVFILWLQPLRITIAGTGWLNVILSWIAILSCYGLLEYYFLYKTAAKDFLLKLKSSWPAALLLSLTLCFFAPLQIYLTNPMEFYFYFHQLIYLLLPAVILVFILLIRILIQFPSGSKSRDRVLSVMVMIGIALWIQGNLLVWNYGILDGSRIDWGRKLYLGLIDSAIWISLLAAAFLRPKLIAGRAKNISLFFIMIQVIFIGLFIFQQLPKDTNRKEPSYRRETFDESKKYDFSRSTNVIILILDEAQSDIFGTLLSLKPEYHQIFEGFTYYPNAVSAFPLTLASVPSSLTSYFYDNREPLFRFVEDTFLSNSIPKKLKDKGFQVELYPYDINNIYFDKRVASNIKKRDQFSENIKELAYLYDISLFRYLPHFIKPLINNNNKWFLYQYASRFNVSQLAISRKIKDKIPNANPRMLVNNNLRFIFQMLENSRTEQTNNCFKFFHIEGMHVQLELDDKFNITSENTKSTGSYNRINYIKEAVSVMKITGMFVNELKRIGTYDNSMIFIIGDHGSGRTGDMYINSGLSKDILSKFEYNNYNFQFSKARGIPFMMIKPFNKKGPLQTSGAPAALYDIPATICDGLNIPSSFNGKSIFKLAENENRTRFHRSYDFLGSTRRYYLGPMTEYEINGNSWLNSSWKKTGRMFVSPEIDSKTNN
jgi:hypothetical protein